MKIYKNIWGKHEDILKSLDFVIHQFESSKLTLSEIQHKKVLIDIDMDFEELIGVLLSARAEINNTKKIEIIEKEEEMKNKK